MDATRTHKKVPISNETLRICLGPDGAVAHVTRCLRMISGRWKLPILFRLYGFEVMRSSQLLKDIPGVS